LEIAESAAMADAKWTDEVISQLKPLGLRISLSEFGSGYSSAKWLHRLPIDELKIDREIVASVLTDRPSNDTVALIVSIGRALKAKVVAEGIESVVQLDQLMSLGCELGQGYLFSHPVSAEKVEKLLGQQGKHAAAGK
jgi:EAL domain-containing protein (putative c-di-GMP-specific phosphodiesterase class I)